MHALLIRYRVLAFTTATLLLIVVFIGIPLQVVAGRPGVVNVVGTVHGVLYIAYLFVAFQLTRSLGVPKGRMLLVLLAGTVPFAAFFAERRMTRRYAEVELAHSPGAAPKRRRLSGRTGVRQRWFSRRALTLHLEVLIVAPACLAAGWWQATRALAGNELSWVYSVEWPIFAIIAVGAWWLLVHEDPDAYRARKERSHRDLEPVVLSAGEGAAEAVEPDDEAAVEASSARLAKILALLIGVQFVLGFVTLASVPMGRPREWLPPRGEAVYLAHALLGLGVTLGAVVLLLRVRHSSRTYQMIGWMGFVGMALAGLGGLLTVDRSLVRFCGIALMFFGPILAGLGYLIPFIARSDAGSVAIAAEQ